MTAGLRLRSATPAAIAEAAELIRAGALVAFPTETVYGLGADATNGVAVAAVFAAKRRPRFNPLIVHVTGLSALEPLVVVDDRARRLAARLWPGPLTLVLPRRMDSGLSWLVSAGLDTVAVRVPDHPVAQALLAACACPVAAPSANPSGAVSPTTAAHVADGLGESVAMILDGGPCRVGVESTVLDLTGPRPLVLRPGGIPAEDLETLVGPLAAATPATTSGEDKLRAPGMLTRHYAPGKPVRIDAAEARPGEALLGFGCGASSAPGSVVLDLSPAGDLREAAANLFAMLHELDRGPWTGIAVMPIPDHGLGRAINDRLRRAAAATASDTAESNADDWDDRGPAAPCVLPDLTRDDE